MGVPTGALKQIEMLLERNYNKLVAIAVEEMKQAVADTVDENRGGLENSFYVEDISSARYCKSGAVKSTRKYALAVNNGRRAIKRKKPNGFLSNVNTFEATGHSPFGWQPKEKGVPSFNITKAGPSTPRHFVEIAKAKIMKRTKEL